MLVCNIPNLLKLDAELCSNPSSEFCQLFRAETWLEWGRNAELQKKLQELNTHSSILIPVALYLLVAGKGFSLESFCVIMRECALRYGKNFSCGMFFGYLQSTL